MKVLDPNCCTANVSFFSFYYKRDLLNYFITVFVLFANIIKGLNIK